MKEIYEKDNIGTPYIEKNYKDVLKQLELEGKIRCQPSADKRRKNSFSDNTLVIFPKTD